MFSQELRYNLDKSTKELNDFKTVMQTIATIQSRTLAIQWKIHEMQETYTVLSEHGIKVRVLFYM